MWGWLTAIVKGWGEAFFGWLREKERDRLLQKETEERLSLERSEAALKKQQEVDDAVSKVRSEPGPTVPDLGGLLPPEK